MGLGCVFFREWGLRASQVKTPRKSIWKYFLWVLCRRLCTNKSGHPGFIITASIRVHCILLQLLPPVIIRQVMHTTNPLRISHFTLLLLIPKQCKVVVWQVQIQVTINGGEMCWLWFAVGLKWGQWCNAVCWGREGQGGRKFDKRHLWVWKSQPAHLVWPSWSSGASLTLVVSVLGDQTCLPGICTTPFIFSMCNSYLRFHRPPVLKRHSGIPAPAKPHQTEMETILLTCSPPGHLKCRLIWSWYYSARIRVIKVALVLILMKVKSKRGL